MTENFMSLCPRSKDYTGYNVTGIPVKVIQSDGVEITPHIKFSEVELDNGAKYFHNNSGKADKFSITCLLNDDEQLTLLKKGETEESPTNTQKVKVTDLLDYFIRQGEPFYVTTRARGISSTNLWRVTENNSRKQHYDDGYIEWSLTFTRYVSFSSAYFKNTNKGVTSALKKYQNKKKKQKKKTAKKKAKSKTSVKSQFKKKCKASNLKYSSKKKVVNCVKLMQKILYKKGCYKVNKKSQIDGWYGKQTKDAVKQFQKRYAKKYKLKQTGNVDKNTFKALISV